MARANPLGRRQLDIPARIPIENKRRFLEVDAEVMEQVDPILYSDLVVAARKGLGNTRGSADPDPRTEFPAAEGFAFPSRKNV